MVSGQSLCWRCELARGRAKQTTELALHNPVRLVSVPTRAMAEHVIDLTVGKQEITRQQFVDGKYAGALVRVLVRYKKGQESQATETANRVVEYLEGHAKFVRRPEFVVAQSEEYEESASIVEHELLKPSGLFAKYLENNAPPSNVGQAGINAVLSVLDEQGDAARAPARMRLAKFVRITGNDFLAFGGRSEIELGHGVYGVSGRYEGEQGTSNRAGKSALLDLVEVALYGECSRGFRGNKGLVHDGATEALAEVECLLTNGKTFASGRLIKGSKIRAVATGMVGDLQEDAERAVIEAIGLSHDDLMRVCFVRQGDLLGLLGAKNASIRDDISRWMGLEIWETVSKELRAQGTTVEASLKSKKAALDEAASESKQQAPSAEEVSRQTDEVEKLVATLAADKERTLRIKNLLSGIEEKEAELAEVQKLNAGQARSELARAEQTEHRLVAEAKTARDAMLAAKAQVGTGPRGKFSGMCPIDNCECPRVKEINSDVTRRKAAQDRYELAQADERRIEEQAREAGRVANAARRKVAEADASDKRIPLITTSLNKMQDELRRATIEPLASDMEKSKLAEMQSKLMDMVRVADRVTQAGVRADKLRDEVASLAVKVDVLKWAVRASGREGVVGMAMQESLSRIEGAANAVLEGMGAAHRLSFDEDGQGKLSVVVIDQSGRRPLAADSGGGKAVLALAVRVALSRMLGAKVLFLDEVCGMLDPMALEDLASMLRALPGLGFEQVFVISHRPEIAETMEHKIVVTRNRASGCSRFGVE